MPRVQAESIVHTDGRQKFRFPHSYFLRLAWSFWIAAQASFTELPDFRDAVQVTCRLQKEIVLDESTEWAHSTPIFVLNSRPGGQINAQITAPRRPFADCFGHHSAQSSPTRYFLSDLHWR